MSQVTLGSFSAPPVAGDLKNDLRVTWDTMGPIAQPKVGPGRESRFGRRMAKCWKCGTRRPKPAASDTGGALTITLNHWVAVVTKHSSEILDSDLPTSD